MLGMRYAHSARPNAARGKHLQLGEETDQEDETPLRILVIGVGNPLLGDDGVGNYVAKLVKERMPQGLNVDIKEVSASGIELVEEIMGYDKAIIVDAVATNGTVGAIRRLKPEQLKNTVHFTAPHFLNFASALEFGKNFAAASMPKRVKIYGVGIRPRTEFSEYLSPKVGKAAELIAEEIIEDLVKAKAR